MAQRPVSSLKRLRAGLCFWLGLGLLPAAAGAESLLWVAQPEGLRPVAAYTEASESFSEAKGPHPVRELPPLLDLLLNGELRSRFEPQDFVSTPAQCTGKGHWQGRYEAAWQGPLLGFSPDFPGVRAYPGNYPSKAFDGAAAQLSQQVYRQRGLKDLSGFRLLRVTPFTLENGQRVFFAAESLIQTARRDCPAHTLLLIGEKVGRQHQIRLQRYRHNTKDCGAYRLVSSFSTGRTVSHLLLQAEVSGSTWYNIVHWQGRQGFVQVFNGGGHRCQSRQN